MTKMRIALIEAFAGMGSLTYALEAGLSEHADVRVAGAIEREEKYLSLWANAHAGGSTFRGSITSFHPAELSVPTPGELRVFVAGIPCTGASSAGMSKKHLVCPEADPQVGHLFLSTAHWIRAHKPDAVVFENVKAYGATLSARCLRAALRASGYVLWERCLDAHAEFETPTRRVRWSMVAVRAGSFHWHPVSTPFRGTLADVLDAPSAQDIEDTFRPEQIEAHDKFLARKASEGCGFARRIVDGTSTVCPTICSTYYKVQPSATFVRTPTGYRMLRPREVARIHGFPESFVLPKVASLAYAVLGQGVCYKPFFALGRALGAHLSGEAVAVEPSSYRASSPVDDAAEFCLC